MSEIENAMETLNNQWYNAVTTALSLDPNKFQLYQGNAPLGNTSDELWCVFDAVPPLSTAHLYDPSQANNFSQNFGGVLSVLKTPSDDEIQSALGDRYVKWIDYLADYDGELPDGGISALLKTWCDRLGVSPSDRDRAYQAYLRSQVDPISSALEAFIAAKCAKKGYAYTGTIKNLKDKIAHGSSKSVTMNSSTQSSDTSKSWAKGSVSGAYKFFWGGAGASIDHLAVKVVKAGIEIKASFDSVVTFAVGPLAKPNTTDIDLRDYKPWYNGQVLGQAYNTKDNTLWIAGKPTNWDSTFGADGNLLRRCTAVVVVDGVSITMTSRASLSKEEQTSFKAQVEGGFFPFFMAKASGGWSHDSKFDDSGTIAVTSSSPKGNPTVLGVLVTPAPDYIAG
jgi:hypothetical protein